jgi:hypothetical protein
VDYRLQRVVHGGQGGSATAHAGKGKEAADAGRGKGKEPATGSGGATATYTQKERDELVQKFVDGIDASKTVKEEAKAKEAREKKETPPVDKERKATLAARTRRRASPSGARRPRARSSATRAARTRGRKTLRLGGTVSSRRRSSTACPTRSRPSSGSIGMRIGRRSRIIFRT